MHWSDIEELLEQIFAVDHEMEDDTEQVAAENRPFVFVNSHEDNELEVSRFIIGITTPFLVERLKRQRTINIDATYRVLKAGYAVIVSSCLAFSS